MNPRNTMSLLLRRILDPLEVRIVNLAPTKVRGIDPFLDLTCLLDHKPDPIVFDVGANDGETVAEFLHAFPEAHVVAFEPYAACCEQLARRFLKNANVRVHNIALGAERSAAQLNLYSGNRMNSLLRLADDPQNPMAKSFQPVGTAEVTVETLDAFCHDHGFTSIDVLKVDTQGYDLEVLKGAARLLAEHRIKAVLLEVNFVPMYERQASFPELHGLLSASGYRLVDFYNQLRSDGVTAWCDACYVSTDRLDVPRRH